jgi:hypothetical protein
VPAYNPICGGLPASAIGVKVLIINDASAANVDGGYKDLYDRIVTNTPLAIGTYNVSCFYFSAS